ncbi:MAG: hypothetical protein U0Z26_18195 [Anaerolineales bacterium]
MIFMAMLNYFSMSAFATFVGIVEVEWHNTELAPNILFQGIDDAHCDHISGSYSGN